MGTYNGQRKRHFVMARGRRLRFRDSTADALSAKYLSSSPLSPHNPSVYFPVFRYRRQPWRLQQKPDRRFA